MPAPGEHMSVQNDLVSILSTLRAARRACPHWDEESDGEGHACCDDVQDALQKFRKVQRAQMRESNNRKPSSGDIVIG